MRPMLISALTFAAATAHATPPPEREAARAVLATWCGKCHDGTRDTAKPEALKVFDLIQPDFSRAMSEAQLRKAEQRLAGTEADAAMREVLARFVAAELAR